MPQTDTFSFPDKQLEPSASIASSIAVTQANELLPMVIHHYLAAHIDIVTIGFNEHIMYFRSLIVAYRSATLIPEGPIQSSVGTIRLLLLRFQHASRLAHWP